MLLPETARRERRKKWTAGRMPEVPNNIDMTVGKLGLTDLEEDQNRNLPANAHGRLTPRRMHDINTFTGSID